MHFTAITFAGARGADDARGVTHCLVAKRKDHACARAESLPAGDMDDAADTGVGADGVIFSG